MVRRVRSVLTLAVVMAVATIALAAGPAAAQNYGEPAPTTAPPSPQETPQHHHPATGAHEHHGGTVVVVVVVVEVAIRDFFFEPALPSVAPGTTVVWVNRGAHPHTVTAFDGSFDSGVLMPGEAFAVTFGGSGRVRYFCEVHPSMTGDVSVGDGGGTASFAFAFAFARAWAGVH